MTENIFNYLSWLVLRSFRFVGETIEGFLYNVGAILAPLPSASIMAIITSTGLRKWLESENVFSPNQIDLISGFVAVGAVLSIEGVMYAGFRFSSALYLENKKMSSFTVAGIVVALSIATLITVEVFAHIGYQVTAFGCLFTLLSSVAYATKAMNKERDDERKDREIAKKLEEDRSRAEIENAPTIIENEHEIKLAREKAKHELAKKKLELMYGGGDGSNREDNIEQTLTSSQKSILEYLRSCDEKPLVTDIAATCGVSRQTVSKALKEFTAKRIPLPFSY